MKYRVLVFASMFLYVSLAGCSSNKNSTANKYTIEKDNGQIILAYKAFEDFLDSDRSWESYKAILLDVYPEVLLVHNRQLGWGAIDTVKFKEDIKNYKKEDFEHLFTQYSLSRLNYLYDSVIEKAQAVLKPLKQKQTDLCFFLPYGSCFVEPEENKNTIYVSMWINPADVEKIMVHEYSHVLHFDRKQDEPLTLHREIVSEGIAVYLTNQILKDIEVANSIPFMPKESFNWCVEHEQLLKDTIRLDLNDTTMQLFTRYISDGSFAKPPEGFVQKTGYFVGYRIIEACAKQGMTVEEICTLDSQAIIDKSNYFRL